MQLCKLFTTLAIFIVTLDKSSAFAPSNRNNYLASYYFSSPPPCSTISSSFVSSSAAARSFTTSSSCSIAATTTSTTISSSTTSSSSSTTSSSSAVAMSSSSAETTAEQPTANVLKLNPSETACVFIEYQNEFTTQGGALYDAVKDCMEATGTLENSRKVLDSARNAGCTIIHVPIAFDKGHNEIAKKPYGILAGIKEGELFKAGEWATEICDIMKPADSDLICKGKNGLCGFSSTNLDFLLRQNGVKNVVLAGFLTNCCVESTMRSAYELGYQVYTLKDCCAATSVAAQDATFEHNFGMFSVPTTSTEVIGALSDSA